MKACCTCKEAKPLSEYYRDKRTRDGLYHRCKECHLVATKRWQRENKEQFYATARKWRAANPDKVRATHAASKRRHRANETLIENRRRARRAGATPEHFTRAELLALWEDAGAYACVYCYAPFEHIEHFVPLSRGGAHALGNLWPSCAECNLAKADRDPWEFLRSLGVAV